MFLEKEKDKLLTVLGRNWPNQPRPTQKYGCTHDRVVGFVDKPLLVQKSEGKPPTDVDVSLTLSFLPLLTSVSFKIGSLTPDGDEDEHPLVVPRPWKARAHVGTCLTKFYPNPSHYGC
jgi:hypothetical protein